MNPQAHERGHAPAVQNGRLVHFSVSQIKDFLRCPRLWAYAKLFGAPREEKPAQTKGKNNHTLAEAYYRGGAEPTNEAFLAALPGLPPRAPDLLVETGLVDPTLFVAADGGPAVRLEGYADLVVPPFADAESGDPGIPVIYDWKFVSSFKYCQDPANDLQMLLYGYWASRKWPRVREVRLTLYYFMVEDSEDYRPASKVVPVERCEAEWLDVVIPAVQRMVALVASAPQSPGAVEGAAPFTPLTEEPPPGPAPDACKMYGGCGFADACGVDLCYDKKSVKVAKRLEAELLAAFDAGPG